MNSFKKIWTKHIVALATIFTVFGSQLVFAEAAEASIESPVVVLERTSQQVIKILRDEHDLLVKEPERVYKIVDDYILPLIDEVTMAKLAMGKNWKKASKEQKDMYETIVEAQRIGFDALRPGIEAHEVHDAVSSYIDNTRFKGRFVHSTGHPVGLAVHDAGAGFNSECKVELKENMVLTVEPGIYIPGFGGVRIEDDILIKKDGVEILTKTSREFMEI